MKTILTIACLMAWSSVYHHDIWLGLFDVDHHHTQSHEHNSSAPHHHEDEPNPSEDDDTLPFNQSIPLPDTHSNALALSSVKVLSTDQDLQASSYAAIPFLCTTIKKLIRVGSENPPPPQGWGEPVPTGMDILASSVQANAPPFVS